MTLPNYCIKLSGKDIDNTNISCTGKQLILIIDELMKQGVWTWYAADVQVVPAVNDWIEYKRLLPCLVGGSLKFKQLANKVEQFLSGVFLGVNERYHHKRFNLEFETEDKVFRDIDMASIEIRAFDTSYFEVYVVEEKDIKGLSKRFQSNILNRKKESNKL